MFCSQCGAKNDDASSFCQDCGAALSGARAEVIVTRKSNQQKTQTATHRRTGSAFLIFILLAGIIVLLYIGFPYLQGRPPHDTNQLFTSNEGGSNATVTTSSLDQEAVSIAKQFIDKRVIRCGDLTYVKTFWNWVGDRHYNRSRDTGRITVYHGNLTEADKMNGIEWSGNVEFELQGPSQTATQYNGYGEWINSAQGTSVGLMKKGGRWVTPQGYDLVDEMPKPITCEEAENPDLFKNWR